jgi:hypothetical protein
MMLMASFITLVLIQLGFKVAGEDDCHSSDRLHYRWDGDDFCFAGIPSGRVNPFIFLRISEVGLLLDVFGNSWSRLFIAPFVAASRCSFVSRGPVSTALSAEA